MGSNPESFRKRGARAIEALAQAARASIEAEARLEAAKTPRKDQLSAGRDQAVGSILQAAGQGQGSLHLVKNSLNGGELSPELGARYDQQRAVMGCRSLYNMAVLPWGGVTKRPPMRMLAGAASSRVRLLPFVFSQEESRILELSCPAGAKKTDLRVFSLAGDVLFQKAEFFPFGWEAANNLSFC